MSSTFKAVTPQPNKLVLQTLFFNSYYEIHLIISNLFNAHVNYIKRSHTERYVKVHTEKNHFTNSD